MTAQDEQAFLAAIVAAPDDDTPRLVFADWLDERGENEDMARAALIRAQCQLEHLPPTSKQRRALARQANAVLKEYGDWWAADLRNARLVRSWAFRRGFLESVTMSATKFAEDAETLFEVAPTIRTARFPDASNEVGRLARCKFLARLASVDIRQMCGCGFCPIQNDLRALFSSKHTQSLTALCVASDRLDEAGAKRLAASKALARLTTLDVSDNPLGADGVRELAKSKHLTQLTTLDLSHAGLGEPGAVALAALDNLPALTRLALRSNRFNAAAIRALVAAPLVAQLTSLDLSGNRFGLAGATALAVLPKTAKLVALDVSKCRLSEKAVRALKTRFGKGLKV